jgi:hypothetical protein
MKKNQIKCIETGVIFPSVSIASKMMNINKKSISMCVNGKIKKAGGYRFEKIFTIHSKEKSVESVVTVENSIDNMVKNFGNNTTETEYLDVISFLLKEYCNYRIMTAKKKDEFFEMKVKYEEYAALNDKYIVLQLENKQLQQQLNNHPQSDNELKAEFDKILEEKRVKWENLVEMYESVCNERDGLTERIQIIINAPEYKSFAERESREGRERAQKEKEAWNNIDNVNDEFSMFASVPRRRTITDYEDERLA